MNDSLNRTPLILVPTESTNDEKGAFLEGIAATLLRKQRFEVTERVRFTGMEIDLLADHKDTRQRAFVECKFVRDPFSTNVIDQLIGKAFRKKADLAYLFSTAQPGKEARGAIDEITRSEAGVSPRFAFVGPEAIVNSFEDTMGLDLGTLMAGRFKDVTSAHLVVTPHLPQFWVLEETIGGLPVRALVLGKDQRALQDNIDSIRNIFIENSVFEGMDIYVPLDDSPEKKATSFDESFGETVPLVIAADTLIDYRPCRPQDFVGRSELQKEVWRFLENVRKHITDTRILALSGQSGYGKSSVLIKLADRFKNQRWRNKFFLHPVDSRAARGPLFVATALKVALENAISNGFIQSVPSQICVDSSESVLDAPDVGNCLEWLRKNGRVLVLFFDQFEEIIYKQQLFPVFEAFRRFAFQVNARQENLVLGFSWRTGITLPDGNPAYHVWHSLAGIRFNLSVRRFSGRESSELVTSFQKALGKRFLNPLRRRLIEQGQGIPWLLKKICIHVYREIKSGLQQHELLERRLNIEGLFEEDLELLSSEESRCLNYIAENSPVDLNEVIERFGDETVNSLYEGKKLIVRTGQKYAIYWDVFRDYLLESGIPPIPWTFVPIVSMSMAIRGFNAIQISGAIDIDSLANTLGYTQKTTMNIIADLQNLVLIVRNDDRTYSVQQDLLKADIKDIALYLHDLFEDHIVIKALKEKSASGEIISNEDFATIIINAYSSVGVQPEIAGQYAKRLNLWLRFLGFLEIHREKFKRPEDSLGKELGVFLDRRATTRGTEGKFLGSASPERVVLLAQMASQNLRISRQDIKNQKNRNAATDLINLGLAKWEEDMLIPSGELIKGKSLDHNACVNLICNKARDTLFISKAIEILKEQPNIDSIGLGEILQNSLEKEWADDSKKRYGGAAKRWVKFLENVTKYRRLGI
jgi:Holliday junction resolvase-like predicted endonuclease